MPKKLARSHFYSMNAPLAAFIATKIDDLYAGEIFATEARYFCLRVNNSHNHHNERSVKSRGSSYLAECIHGRTGNSCLLPNTEGHQRSHWHTAVLTWTHPTSRGRTAPLFPLPRSYAVSLGNRPRGAR